MKLTFKQFLKESGQNAFDSVKDMIELIDDSIRLKQTSGPYMFFRFPEGMGINEKEAIVNKIKKHTNDEVYVLFDKESDLLSVVNVAIAEVVGLNANVTTLNMHDDFVEDTIQYLNDQNRMFSTDLLYCDRGIADSINCEKEVLFLVLSGKAKGHIALLGSSNWSNQSSGGKMLVSIYNDLKVGDKVQLVFDTNAETRWQRFKFYGKLE